MKYYGIRQGDSLYKFNEIEDLYNYLEGATKQKRNMSAAAQGDNQRNLKAHQSPLSQTGYGSDYASDDDEEEKDNSIGPRPKYVG